MSEGGGHYIYMKHEEKKYKKNEENLEMVDYTNKQQDGVNFYDIRDTLRIKGQKSYTDNIMYSF